MLFLGSDNEHPYRVERGLLHLHQAGVLDFPKAIVIGAFSDFARLRVRGAGAGYAQQRPRMLPFGHVPTKVCLPVGRRVNRVVQGREVLTGW